MLRITLLSQDKEEVILKVEGRIAGADVALLEREIRGKFELTQRLVLDLQGLKHIDREGLQLLKHLSKGKLVLRDSSVFVRTLLQAYGLE
mgnify:FL=1